jgi:cell division protein FtsW (lipid II flippase)
LLLQSLMSFASGGVAGRGLGNGIQKLGSVLLYFDNRFSFMNQNNR